MMRYINMEKPVIHWQSTNCEIANVAVMVGLWCGKIESVADSMEFIASIETVWSSPVTYRNNCLISESEKPLEIAVLFMGNVSLF